MQKKYERQLYVNNEEDTYHKNNHKNVAINIHSNLMIKV